MSNMSSPLSEVDRELLGEISNTSGAKATMAEANGEPSTEAHDDHLGAAFTPLNATTGTSVKVSSNGDEVETGKVNKDTKMDTTEPALKTPKKRGAAASANDESAQPTKKRSPTKKAAAASNVEANTNGEATETTTPALKKRASPKKKAVANPNADTEDGEMNGETEGPEPVTPKKKGKRAAAKSKTNDESADTTDKSISPTKGNGEVEGTTVHNTPRKRQAPKKELAAPRGIPTSWDEADQADRMMVSMKEKGESWIEIRAMWKKVTGQETAASTLPNRYNRIKVNMMRMKDGDDIHLLAAKKEIEETYLSTFWATVASNMERRGSDKYPAAFLQKTFKELEAAGKTKAAGAGAEEEGVDEGEGVKEEDTAGTAGNGEGQA